MDQGDLEGGRGSFLYISDELCPWTSTVGVCLARLQAVVAWSDAVEECSIVTAVAGSSEKVGGSRTQFRVVEPLSRSELRASDHQRPRIRSPSADRVCSARGEESFFKIL